MVEHSRKVNLMSPMGRRMVKVGIQAEGAFELPKKLLKVEV